jgi:hypothetical protein
VLEDLYGRPILQCCSHHVRELLTLGFQHLSPSGRTDQRPDRGRHSGETYFDETLGRPLWWHDGQWRDATGAAA